MRIGLSLVWVLLFLQLRVSGQAPVITINSITPNQPTYCTGDSITINFGTSSFTGNNIFVMRLSKSGFVNDSTNAGSITFSGNQSSAIIGYRFPNQDGDADSAYQIRIRSGVTVSALFPTTSFLVNPRPVALASISTQTICSGNYFNTISLSTGNNVPNTTYTWSRNNTTNISGTINGTGDIAGTFLINNTPVNQTVTYTITPTGPAFSSCVGNSITSVVIVKPAPTVTSINADSVCSGKGFSISLTSTIASSYLWFADDNLNTIGEELSLHTTSLLIDTVTNLTTSDEVVFYSVIPTSNTGSCQGEQQTIAVTVHPTPTIANDTVAAICSGTLVSIPLISNVLSRYTWKATANASVTGESTALQTTDTLNNTLINTTSSLQTVVYTITATSLSNACAANPHILLAKVYPKPAAAFTVANSNLLCERVGVRFTATTNVSITNYDWTFGNPLFPSSDTGAILTESFTGTGDSIPVKLIIQTSFGCKDSLQKFINIYPTPFADFSVSDTTPCSGDTVNFVHTDTNNANSLIWVWGDGTANTTCSGCSVGKHRYSSTSFPSVRSMQLIATSVKGCKDTSAVPIRVKPNPRANFTVNDNTQCLNFGNHQFVFTDNSTIADSLNNSLTYLWDFDDGLSVETTKDASHTYAAPDSYFVYHLLVTSFGCRDSITKLMLVYSDPHSTIKNSKGTDTLCGQTTLTLTADSGYTYLWSTNKTTRSIIVKDSVLPNPYTVVYAVTVTDNHLCTATASKQITVNPATAKPEIGYDTSLIFCAGAKAQLFQIVNPINASYVWSTLPDILPPNGYSGSPFNIDIPGLAGDTFSIRVIATDNTTGCTNSDTAIIYLSENQAPDARVVRDLLTLLCTNNTVSQYQWGFDDTNLQEHTLAGETLQSYYAGSDPDVTVSGKYYWVKITDEGGCQSKIYYQSPPSYLTGITANSYENSRLKIYPNPVQGLFKIEMEGYTTAIKTVEVCSPAGQLIFKETYRNEMTIDASQWNTGLYLLKVISESGVYKTQRLIKMQ